MQEHYLTEEEKQYLKTGRRNIWAVIYFALLMDAFLIIFCYYNLQDHEQYSLIFLIVVASSILSFAFISIFFSKRIQKFTNDIDSGLAEVLEGPISIPILQNMNRKSQQSGLAIMMNGKQLNVPFRFSKNKYLEGDILRIKRGSVSKQIVSVEKIH